LKLFMDRYIKGEPFFLSAYIFDNNELKEISEIRPIQKYHLKYKKRAELKKDEFEYVHGKNVMKK
ncbi:unnamed protein product, partial [marine sediment metagenome]